MKKSPSLFSSLFLGVLVLGCAKDDGAADQPTTNPPGPSGSETGAPDSSSSGDPSGATTGPVDPTMATTGAPGTDGGTTDGCSFLNCEEIPIGDCDNWTQDCPEGQKCSAWISDGGDAWNSVRCVEVIGEDRVGDECRTESVASGQDSCEKGAMCWAVNAEGIGTCVALCTGSPEAPVCGGDITCTIANEGAINLCLANCDPLLQDCLADGEACYPVAGSFTCAPDASGEEGQANDPCEFINVCDKGLMCADTAFVGAGCDPASKGCCTPFCEFPGGPCPNPDQSCVQYYDPANPPFPNAEDIGVCGIPS